MSVRKRAIMIIILIIAIVISVDNNFKFNSGYNNEINIKDVQNDMLAEEIMESYNLLKDRALSLKNKKNERGLSFNTVFGRNYIGESTSLIIQSYYIGSDKLVQHIREMPEAFIGLTLGEFKSITGKWQIKSYNSGTVLVLQRKIDDLAPEDKKIMHLGIKEGKVAIFYGRTGNKHLRKLTEIEVSKLPYSERKSLEKGIVINSQEELLAVLDGLMSTINMD
ncbi:MAG: BofC C-terminal domain-containing protein [Halothermotrichaceae bacterium]